MRRILQVPFKFEGRMFIEIPDAIAKMARIKPSEIFAPELAPTGDIVFKRVEEENAKQ